MLDQNGQAIDIGSFVYYNGSLCRVTRLDYVVNKVTIESVQLFTRLNPFRILAPLQVYPTQLIVSRGEL